MRELQEHKVLRVQQDTQVHKETWGQQVLKVIRELRVMSDQQVQQDHKEHKEHKVHKVM
jgi:hypothetical protein